MDTIPDYMTDIFSFNDDLPDLPQQSKRKAFSSYDILGSPEQEVYDSGIDMEPFSKRIRYEPNMSSNFDPLACDPLTAPSFLTNEPDFDFLNSIQDVDWDAALATAIAQSSSSEWMTHYDSLRKTINAGDTPSDKDTKWLETQLIEMQSGNLTPERSELLRQALDMLTFASFEKTIKEEPTLHLSMAPTSISIQLKPEPLSLDKLPPLFPAKKMNIKSCSKSVMKRNQLASWMCTQRQDRKSAELPEYRIRLLDMLDFAWTKHHKKRPNRENDTVIIDNMTEDEFMNLERNILNDIDYTSFNGRAKKNHELWLLRYHELVSFKRKNGHLKVPTHIPDDGAVQNES